MLSRRRRHAREQGQTLVLAIAFLAVFALLSTAVIGLARAVDSQRSSTERTAAVDSVVDGSAQLALSASNAANCGSVTGASLTFPGTIRADTLTYAVPTGTSGCGTSTSGGTVAGSLCQLCILGPSSPNPATAELSAGSHGLICVDGEIDVNGSISGGSSGSCNGKTTTVTAYGPNAKIGIYGYGSGGTCGSCSPTPTDLTTPFHDPLAGLVPSPTSSTTQTCCSATINPGVYSGMNLTSQVSMNSGVYIVTGGISVSGHGLLESNSDASSSSETDSDAAANTDSGSGLHDSGSGGATDSGHAGNTDSGTSTGGNATTLTDSSKNWAANQWAGAIVTVTLSTHGHTTTTTAATVASNTKTVLTISGSWSNGSPSSGKAYTLDLTGFTSNTLTDSSKTWTANQWANALVTVGSVTGYVSSNNAHTLTMTANWSTQPSDGSAYSIAMLGYTSNTLTDASKSWTTNGWAGAQVTVGAQTGTVASNTAHTLTMQANWGTTPAAGSAYSIVTLYYGTKTLTDSTKTWAAGAWNGAQVTVGAQTGIVSSNTSNTLTLTANWGTTPATGSAYSITTLYYGTKTLTDSTKSWTTNEWAGAQVTANGETSTVASNTATALTLSSAWPSGTPASGTAYTVSGLYYTATTLVDTAKSWTTNEWNGALVTVTLSNNSTETATVASNTANTLTLQAPWQTTPSLGNQYTVAAQVVIYLACPTSGPSWTCSSGGTGGNISISGQGSMSITPPATGLYAGIAVFTDPQLTNAAGGCVVCVAGNGGSLGGTVYAPKGDVSIQGGGSSGQGLSLTGRLIVRSLSLSGNSNAQMTFTGPWTSSTTTCSYFVATLGGTEAGGTATHGHVGFETDCASAGLNGQGGTSGATVISFAYGP